MISISIVYVLHTVLNEIPGARCFCSYINDHGIVNVTYNGIKTNSSFTTDACSVGVYTWSSKASRWKTLLLWRRWKPCFTFQCFWPQRKSSIISIRMLTVRNMRAGPVIPYMSLQARNQKWPTACGRRRNESALSVRHFSLGGWEGQMAITVSPVSHVKGTLWSGYLMY